MAIRHPNGRGRRFQNESCVPSTLLARWGRALHAYVIITVDVHVGRSRRKIPFACFRHVLWCILKLKHQGIIMGCKARQLNKPPGQDDFRRGLFCDFMKELQDDKHVLHHNLLAWTWR